MRVKSITTDYDQDEDRIFLAVVDSKNTRRKLWLTRRLTERLISALVQGLTIRTEDDQPVAPRAIEAAQVYAQLEARISRKPATPVEMDNSATQYLVNQIKVKTADNEVRVIEFYFKAASDKASPPVELVLTPTELRQWLEVLRTTTVTSQWREDIWPDWFKTRH
jgi:hypothetical protein